MGLSALTTIVYTHVTQFIVGTRLLQRRISSGIRAMLRSNVQGSRYRIWMTATWSFSSVYECVYLNEFLDAPQLL